MYYNFNKTVNSLSNSIKVWFSFNKTKRWFKCLLNMRLMIKAVELCWTEADDFSSGLGPSLAAAITGYASLSLKSRDSFLRSLNATAALPPEQRQTGNESQTL